MDMNEYVTLDSGERRDFPTGARRDTDTQKARFDLLPASALRRWAELMGRGAAKYGDRNWEKGMPVSVFRASAERHWQQWIEGNVDEDHLAAVLFNVGAIAEMEALADLGVIPAWFLDEGASQVHPADIRREQFEEMLSQRPDFHFKFKYMLHRHGDVFLVFDNGVAVFSAKEFDLLSEDELFERIANELHPL